MIRPMRYWTMAYSIAAIPRSSSSRGSMPVPKTRGSSSMSKPLNRRRICVRSVRFSSFPSQRTLDCVVSRPAKGVPLITASASAVRNVDLPSFVSDERSHEVVVGQEPPDAPDGLDREFDHGWDMHLEACPEEAVVFLLLADDFAVAIL